MALTPALTALLAMGGALAVAFLASALFRATHVPDILALLGIGALLGPVLHVLTPGLLKAALPILSALAVITILFDGALEVTPGHLRSFGVPAIGLSLTVATTTTLLCAIIAHAEAGLPWGSATLLGLCFGGAGIAIIVPLAQRMRVSHEAMAVILLEAVTSDIFVIVGMGIACTAVAAGSVDPALGVRFLRVLGGAVLVGPAAGWLWARFLARWGHATNAYVATLAVLVLAYAAAEVIGGSGPLAVLLFGIVVGNAKGRPLGSGLRNRVFGRELVAFHHEVAFTVAACRSLGVLTALGRSGLSRWDRAATALLFPMGLVTAAVSVIPRTFGIPGADRIVDFAAVVIVLTNVLGTLAVFLGVRLRPPAPPKPIPPGLAD